MAKMKYALFGATGSVGKALAARLAERGQPFVLSDVQKSGCGRILRFLPRRRVSRK